MTAMSIRLKMLLPMIALSLVSIIMVLTAVVLIFSSYAVLTQLVGRFKLRYEGPAESPGAGERWRGPFDSGMSLRG